MSRNLLVPQNDRSHRRLRVAGRVVFALLAIHFVLVYTAPTYLMIPLQGRRSAFSPRNFGLAGQGGPGFRRAPGQPGF